MPMEACGPPNMLLQWHITERCNLHCAHCYQEGTPVSEMTFAELLDVLGQFRFFLRALRREYGPLPAQITLTGGEPLLRDDFFPLLEAFAPYREMFGLAVLTNGTLVDAAAARRLAAFGPRFVQVSIDGGEATHDAVRGAGAYRAACEGARHLVRAGVPVYLAFTAQRDNYREFREVARLGRRLGVARVWADRLIPCGGGAAMFTLDPEETRDFFLRMRDARDEARRAWFGRTEIAMHRGLQFLVGGGRPYVCSAGGSLLALLPNGDLLPCRRLPLVVGNVKKAPLHRLWREAALLRSLREAEQTPAACSGCFYRQLCRGGLRCLAYACTGDPFARDPGCWIAPEGEPR